MENLDYTMTFQTLKDDKESEKDIMKIVYKSLLERGYNPANQLVGYFLSGDPSYITSHNNARTLIKKFERDELLEVIIKGYVES